MLTFKTEKVDKSEYQRKYMKSYYDKHPEVAEKNKQQNRRRYYKRKGLSDEEVDELLHYLDNRPKFNQK